MKTKMKKGKSVIQSILDPVKSKEKGEERDQECCGWGRGGGGEVKYSVLCEWKFSLYTISSGSNVTAIHSFKILQLL